MKMEASPHIFPHVAPWVGQTFIYSQSPSPQVLSSVEANY